MILEFSFSQKAHQCLQCNKEKLNNTNRNLQLIFLQTDFQSTWRYWLFLHCFSYFGTVNYNRPVDPIFGLQKSKYRKKRKLPFILSLYDWSWAATLLVCENMACGSFSKWRVTDSNTNTMMLLLKYDNTKLRLIRSRR